MKHRVVIMVEVEHDDLPKKLTHNNLSDIAWAVEGGELRFRNATVWTVDGFFKDVADSAKKFK